ncbi:kinase-like domain-containing protein, partial [Thelephora terrestris]
LRVLHRTCGRHALLPGVLMVSVDYGQTSTESPRRGGYADVWKAEYRGQDVAVKAIRTYSNRELRKVFCKEVVMWRFLQHPNVLPLKGVMMSQNRFAMVLEWMKNGDINDFIEAHPDVNRLELLAGAAGGLIYLHNNGMVHGDIKGANILIDDTGHPRLADFGLLTIISDPANLLSSSSNSQGGTVRWMGPELIAPQQFGCKKSRPTKSSDCYALGMVIYETVSGKLPFHKDSDYTISLKVVKGERPLRGANFTNYLWSMLELCWTSQPKARPSIEDVLQRLEIASNSWEPPSPGSDEEMEVDSDDWDSSDGSCPIQTGTRGAAEVDSDDRDSSKKDRRTPEEAPSSIGFYKTPPPPPSLSMTVYTLLVRLIL